MLGCVANNQRGTDAVWEMRWFLELNFPAVNNLDRKVTEYAIEKRNLLDLPNQGLKIDIPGYYLAHRRAWSPPRNSSARP